MELTQEELERLAKILRFVRAEDNINWNDDDLGLMHLIIGRSTLEGYQEKA